MAADTRANFNYTVDTGVLPEIYFYDTPLSAGLRSPGDAPHEMVIRDGWSRASSFSLDREGFALGDFSSPFDRWDEDAAIRSEFYGNVTEYVRQTVGAKRVVANVNPKLLFERMDEIPRRIDEVNAYFNE